MKRIKIILKHFFRSLDNNKRFLSICKRRFFRRLERRQKKFIFWIEKATGYKIFKMQDALVVGSLFLVFWKIFFRFFLLIQLPFYYNITILYFFSFLALKFDFYSFLRERLASLFSRTIGERNLFQYDTFSEIYYEEDYFRTRPAGVLIDKTKDRAFHKRNPDFEYYFEEPQSTLINKITMEVIICAVHLRLFFRAEPTLFMFSKLLLSYLLIFNHLLPIAYSITLIGIFSRFVFFLTDINSKQINTTYNIIRNQNWEFAFRLASELPNETLVAAPVRYNAIILGYWLIRSLGENRESFLLFQINENSDDVWNGYTFGLYARVFNNNYISTSIDKTKFFISYQGSKYIKYITGIVISLILWWWSIRLGLVEMNLSQNIFPTVCLRAPVGKWQAVEELIGKIVISRTGRKKPLPSGDGHPRLCREIDAKFHEITNYSTINPRGNRPSLFFRQSKTFPQQGIATRVSRREGPMPEGEKTESKDIINESGCQTHAQSQEIENHLLANSKAYREFHAKTLSKYTPAAQFDLEFLPHYNPLLDCTYETFEERMERIKLAKEYCLERGKDPKLTTNEKRLYKETVEGYDILIKKLDELSALFKEIDISQYSASEGEWKKNIENMTKEIKNRNEKTVIENLEDFRISMQKTKGIPQSQYNKENSQNYKTENQEREENYRKEKEKQKENERQRKEKKKEEDID